MNIKKAKEFINYELSGWSPFEISIVGFMLFVVIFNKIILHDSSIAVISAVCGVMYTVIAGKGKLSCYLFGLTGSGFYGYLALINSLWGNLLLYIGYYVPMQIIGIFKWSKHLKPSTNEIFKTKLTPKGRIFLAIVSIGLCLCGWLVLRETNNPHPVADSVTTMLSLVGMYLTVKRCIEQWIVWTIVNLTALIMWLNIALHGAKVYSTVLMWSCYLLLGLYFYTQWSKELKNSDNIH